MSRNHWRLLLALIALFAGLVLLFYPRETARNQTVRPAQASPAQEDPTHRLGLFTTLPIYWGEAGSIGEMLSQPSAPHWVRTRLEQSNILIPLDVLGQGNAELATLDRLMLAQPRALSGAENVALDEWVRAGGRVLIFADPMLTQHSEFHLGDRRRPQDVVLLSPILTRWGLDLTYDEAQPRSETVAALGGTALPIHLAGRLQATGDGADSKCRTMASGLVAQCDIGAGRATILADAAVLEGPQSDTQRPAALERILALSFD